MEKTKAVAHAVYHDFSTLWKRQRNQFNRWFNKRSDKLAVKVMRWLIERDTVQQVVADTFSGDTPMCRLLREAAENAVESADGNRTIDVDAVQGLGGYIEREFDDKLGELESERWFTDAVANAIDNEKIAEALSDDDNLVKEISERVVELLVERLQK